MIKIDLSRHHDAQPPIRFSVSPLFEIAASLHVLTQALPTIQHYQWVKKTLEILKREGLYAEWLYFAPLFFHAIPSLFAVQHTETLRTEEEQLNYLTELSTEQFVQSCRELLHMSIRNRVLPHHSTALRNDLLREPELLKSRFNLFLAAYTHYIFRKTWDELQPVVAREQAHFERLHSPQDVCQFLQPMLPYPLAYNTSQLLIGLPDGEDAKPGMVVRLALHPSWFFAHAPVCRPVGDTLHISYSLLPR